MERQGQDAFHVVVAAAAAGGFDVAFEEVAAALERIERLYFEPDGSFVWADGAWQIDGLVCDRDGRVQYVELKGTAPAADVRRLLAMLGWPATAVTIQLVREGILMSAEAFLGRLGDGDGAAAKAGR